MTIDLNFCVDESQNKFRLLKEIAHGGQGSVFQTQFPNIVLKLELKNNRPIPITETARKKFLAVRNFLPILNAVNVTLPWNILEKFSGYTMQMMDDMISFKAAFSGDVDDLPSKSSWTESFAESNPELAKFFSRLIKRGGLRRFFRAYLNAAQILAKIHGVGLVYCDFSANNVLISNDHAFCNVWLIDCDNLDYQKNTRGKILFTPHIGAPELHDGSGGCTFYSDAFAFAATMFCQLTNHHPFDGALFDEKLAELDLEDAENFRDCGGFPWIFDSDDDENFFDGGEIFLELMPPKILRLFDETFGREVGLFKISRRPSMSEWSFALAQTVDEIIRCPHCLMDRHGGEKCPWCDGVHPVVVMRAKFECGAELWNFSHEISEGLAVDVPLRIVHGWRVDELDEVAFKFAWKGGRFVMTCVGEKFFAEFSDENSARIRAAILETSAKKFFVHCTDAQNFKSTIEVRILNATD